MNLNDFTACSDSTVLDALIKIDANKKGFLIIVKEGTVIGVLTDGDLRRAFINGADKNSVIDPYINQKFKHIIIGEGFEKVVECFKSSLISFLPILDDKDRLLNVITKDNLHALLLQDISFDLNYDFLGVDDTLPDFEIYPRPWGFYKTSIINRYFQSKTIKVNPGGKLSLQMHRHREEHWIVVHGTGQVQLAESVIDVSPGSYLFVPKECKHRITNTSPTESLIFTEVQLGESFGEEDIIRFEDVYGRI